MCTCRTQDRSSALRDSMSSMSLLGRSLKKQTFKYQYSCTTRCCCIHENITTAHSIKSAHLLQWNSWTLPKTSTNVLPSSSLAYVNIGFTNIADAVDFLKGFLLLMLHIVYNLSFYQLLGLSRKVTFVTFDMNWLQWPCYGLETSPLKMFKTNIHGCRKTNKQATERLYADVKRIRSILYLQEDVFLCWTHLHTRPDRRRPGRRGPSFRLSPPLWTDIRGL